MPKDFTVRTIRCYTGKHALTVEREGICVQTTQDGEAVMVFLTDDNKLELAKAILDSIGKGVQR